MPKHLYFEDLHPGDRWISPTRVVTEEDVVGFVRLTGDFNPLHVDKELRNVPPLANRSLTVCWDSLSSPAWPAIIRMWKPWHFWVSTIGDFSSPSSSTIACTLSRRSPKRGPMVGSAVA